MKVRNLSRRRGLVSGQNGAGAGAVAVPGADLGGGWGKKSRFTTAGGQLLRELRCTQRFQPRIFGTRRDECHTPNTDYHQPGKHTLAETGGDEAGTPTLRYAATAQSASLRSVCVARAPRHRLRQAQGMSGNMLRTCHTESPLPLLPFRLLCGRTAQPVRNDHVGQGQSRDQDYAGSEELRDV